MALTSTVLPYKDRIRLAGARLCDFLNGVSEPLPSHKDWITRYFVPAMKMYPNAWIDFIGFSPRSAKAVTNVQLSARRIAATEACIKQQYPGIKVNLRLSEDDTEAKDFHTPEANNSGFWRAVLIRWYGIPSDIPTPVYTPDRFASPLMYRVYGVIPTAEVWRAAAVRVLEATTRALSTKTPTDDDLVALALVDRCFKVKEAGRTDAQAAADVASIRRVFDEIGKLFAAITSGKEYLHEDETGNAKAFAYTHCGHWVYKKPADGIWYVRKNLVGKSDEFIVDATMHESAHFVGPEGRGEIGHAEVGGETAYGQLALKLKRADALVNASSYAWLAYLARKPQSEWITAA
jgi:hypothetical protein